MEEGEEEHLVGRVVLGEGPGGEHRPLGDQRVPPVHLHTHRICFYPDLSQTGFVSYRICFIQDLFQTGFVSCRICFIQNLFKTEFVVVANEILLYAL